MPRFPPVRFLLALVPAFVFYLGHGLEFHLTPWSQALINGVTSLTYSHAGQNETTVLLFTDQDLSDLPPPTYPVPYTVHAEVLDALRGYKPRAVFIDFGFIDDRPGDKAEVLFASICALRDSGTKVFLAAPVVGETRRAAHGEFSKCAQEVSTYVDDEEGLSGVLTYSAGKCVEGFNPPDGNRRPCEMPAPIPGKRVGQFMPSAAFALAGFDPPDTGSPPKPMELLWPAGEHWQNKKFMRRECASMSIYEKVKGVFHEGPLGIKRGCPWTRTLAIRHLLFTSNDPEVEQSLSGKTVLYGASFALATDQVKSPIFKNLPGVYLHAVAYDNLISLKRDYKKPPDEGSLAISTLFVLVIGAVVLGFLPDPKDVPQNYQSLLKRYKNIMIALSLLVVICLWIVFISDMHQELQLLAPFFIYFYFRWITNKRMMWLAFLSFIVALLNYSLSDVSIRSFLSIIVFFEVVNHVFHLIDSASHRFFEALEKERVGDPPRKIVEKFLTCFFWSVTLHRSVDHENDRNVFCRMRRAVVPGRAAGSR